MSWVNSFNDFIGDLLDNSPICKITEIEKRQFSIHVTYTEGNLEDVFWFGVDELSMVNGVNFEEKVKNVMKLYNFNVL